MVIEETTSVTNQETWDDKDVFLDLAINNQSIGRIVIKLYT